MKGMFPVWFQTSVPNSISHLRTVTVRVRTHTDTQADRQRHKERTLSPPFTTFIFTEIIKVTPSLIGSAHSDSLYIIDKDVWKKQRHNGTVPI